MQSPHHAAFTRHFGQRSNILFNKVSVSKPNDRSNINETNAIWDTGATGTVITKGFAKKLGLKPVGIRRVKGVHEEKDVSVYLVDIYLPNKVLIQGVSVTECQELNNKIQSELLIGMDIIGIGDLAISNYNGKTTFTYRVPSIEETDYVRRIRESKKIIAQKRSEGLKKMGQNVRNILSKKRK